MMGCLTIPYMMVIKPIYHNQNRRKSFPHKGLGLSGAGGPFPNSLPDKDLHHFRNVL